MLSPRDLASSFRRPAPAAAAATLVLLAWPAMASAQAVLAYDLIEPRTFGYVIGDKIRREVRLSVRSGYRLDAASLPKAGRLDRWLEVAAPELRAESIANGWRYHLVLSYQIVNAPRSLATVTLPRQDLRLVGETQTVTTLVPALEVTVAPLTSGLAADRVSGSALQPDRPPAPLPVQGRQTRLAWTGTALLALLLLVVGRRGQRALMARRDLPFARAVRQLKQLPAPGAPADRVTGLRIVHAAVNRTAGHAVFAHNLGAFLAAHPEFAGLRGEFERMFAASGSVFFADAAAGAPSGSDPGALLHLCRLCRRIERRSFGERAGGVH